MESSKNFRAAFNVATYISPSEEQVLELSFVTVAEDVLPDLKERASSIRGTSVFPSELPFVSCPTRFNQVDSASNSSKVLFAQPACS